MTICYRCNRNPAVRDGLCEECIKANPHQGKHGRIPISFGKSFEQYFNEELKNKGKFESLLIADDTLLQYEFYKYDHKFVPILGGESASYRDEHRKLEDFYFDLFNQLFKERINSLDISGIDGSAIQTIKDDFFRFHSSIIQLMICNQNIGSNFNSSYIGTPETFSILLFLKKNLIYIGVDPSFIDYATTQFDPGSALFFLEIYMQLKEQELLAKLQQLSTIKQDYARNIIRAPTLLVFPWDHQKSAFDAWRKNNYHGILEMATATGKTVVGLMAIEALYQQKPKGTARVFAHSTNILNQWKRELIEKLGIIDRYTEDFRTPIKINGFSIYFNTLQTVYKQPQFYPANLLIADEVHHTAAPKFRNALQIDCEWKMGLSATVEGENRGEILERELGKVVFSFPLSVALEKGILPRFMWYVCPVYLSPQENEEFKKISDIIKEKFFEIQGDTHTISQILGHGNFNLENIFDFIKIIEYARYRNIKLPDDWKILQGLILKRRWIIHRSHPRLEDAIDLIKKLWPDHKIIIFTMDIESCDKIAKELSDEVKSIFVIHSQIKENPFNLIEKFRKSKNGVLIGARMLDEGIDIPDADIGINVASSKTRLQLIQRLGRILRKNEDKKPIFYHYVAIPDPNNYVKDIDDLEFLDDLAWVQDTALKMGLDVQVQYSNERLNKLSIDAEKEIHNRYYRQGRVETKKIGTLNISAILQNFTPEITDQIISQLIKYKNNAIISDNEWTDIIRTSFGKEKDQTLNIPGYWWLLILGDRNPQNIIKIFNPDFNIEQVTDSLINKIVNGIKQTPSEDFKLRKMGKNALHLYNIHQYNDAIKICDELLEIHPNITTILNLKGNSLIQLKKYHDAVACYRAALNNDPNKTYIWENLYLAYLYLEMENEADMCKKAIEKLGKKVDRY